MSDDKKGQMTHEEVTILARLVLLSMPPALLSQPFTQAEVEWIAKDAHRVAHRYAARIAALEDERDRLRADLRQVSDDLTKAWRSESAVKRGDDVLVDAFDKMIDAARAATGAGQ